ncbi:hypothetical protein ACFO25_11095 [Paenactinomyces guangxiensis]|uniref:MutS-like protein n=1 Tax=Paenactinomyces guangxiensis TaxID=1490290 RepID=A0A7W2A8P8_9BACL|nr:hypothetical protein [Paenactinomyces guangxiensis]MBA4494058.1 hypothetical protein [Paenactinomyces guangxiensis]MBH8591197.1 hypothetical protein [Paenactinomyces guangxiensis]
MLVDEETRQDLHVDEIWSWFQPFTPMGEQAKRKCTPFLPGQETEWQQLLLEQEEMQKQLSAIPKQIGRLEEILRRVPDIAGILERWTAAKSPGLTEWFKIKQFLWQLSEWSKWMELAQMPSSLILTPAEKEMCEMLLWKLNPTPPLQPSFAFVDGYDGRLKQLRRQRNAIEREFREQKEEEAQKVDSTYRIRRNRLGEWVAVKGSQLDQALKQEACLRLARETVYDSVYVFQHPNEAACQQQLDHITKKIESLEQEISVGLAEFFRPYIPVLQTWVQKLAHFDLQWARIRAAQIWQGVKPEHSEELFEIDRGFHPVIARHLRETGLSVTPVQLTLRRGVTVIIGPNMGGKTVALKTAGIIAVLAGYGFFVPAAACKIPLFPWVTSLIGDRQNVNQGLSSFGAEIARLSKWVRRKEEGLLLLDELGRGTNPVEGAALSQAVTKYFIDAGKWVVHVTHYREVIVIEGIQGYRVAGIQLKHLQERMAGHPGQIHRLLQEQMDYRLIPLQKTDSLPEQAIVIAEALGLDPIITQEAKRLVNKERGEEYDGS